MSQDEPQHEITPEVGSEAMPSEDTDPDDEQRREAAERAARAVDTGATDAGAEGRE